MLIFPAIVEPLRLSGADPLSFESAIKFSFPGYLAFGLSALPIGFLARTFSARKLLAIGNLVIAICALGAATVSEPEHLTWWLLGLGIGAGFYHPVGITLVSNSIRARGKGQGIQGVFGNLGIASAPAVGGICAYYETWRVAYYALAFVALIVFLGVVMARIEEGVVDQVSRHQVDLDATTRNRVIMFVLLALGMVCAGFVYRGFQTLAPKHLGGTLLDDSEAIRHGAANLWGAIFTSLALFVAAVGQLVGGYYADRISLMKGYVLFHLCSIPFLAGLGLMSGMNLPVMAACFAFFNLGMQPFENSLVARLIPPAWRSVGYGLKFIFSFGVGSVSVHFVGAQERIGGTDRALLMLIPFLGVLLILGGMLWIMEIRTSAGGDKGGNR
jgi:MFS family permease